MGWGWVGSMRKEEERREGGEGGGEEEEDTVQMSPGVKMCEPGNLPSSLTLSCFVFGALFSISLNQSRLPTLVLGTLTNPF
jgi:hypothetical protein